MSRSSRRNSRSSRRISRSSRRISRSSRRGLSSSRNWTERSISIVFLEGSLRAAKSLGPLSGRASRGLSMSFEVLQLDCSCSRRSSVSRRSLSSRSRRSTSSPSGREEYFSLRLLRHLASFGGRYGSAGRASVFSDGPLRQLDSAGRSFREGLASYPRQR